MSRLMKLMAMAAVSVTMLTPSVACADTWTNANGSVWTYALTNDCAMVMSVASEEADLSVPESLDDKPTTLIGTGAFADCGALKSVIFPNQDGEIGFWQGAFKSGTSVTMEAEEGYAFSRWVDAEGNEIKPTSFTNDFVSVRAEFTPVVIVKDVSFRQRYPWNGLVDIDFTVDYIDPETNITISVSARDEETGKSLAVRNMWLENDVTHTNALEVKSGTHRLVWDAGKDNPNLVSGAVSVEMQALLGAGLYMVIDLSGGPDAAYYPISYLGSEPHGGWSDEYKTTKLVLRRIPAGTFMMGSPLDEIGRRSDETQHEVTISKPFYIGIFEVTQKQYELVTGNRPSSSKQGDMCPVENVSWNMIRGNSETYNWPLSVELDALSFMGKLRSKTGICTFDLPTEAKWEYACRAGTISALNNGNDLISGYQDSAMDRVGRYESNQSDGNGGYSSGYTTVGSYLANEWGLYDMHGNVWEWCLDWYDYYSGNAEVDPVGPKNGYRRVLRGGSCVEKAMNSRSAVRCMGNNPPSGHWWDGGFRISCSDGTGTSNTIAGGEVAFGSGASEINWLDLNEGVRLATAGIGESLAYSPLWGGATSCTVSEDDVILNTASTEGSVEWIPDGIGLHTLTHTAGETVYTAQFTVLGDDVLIHAGTLSSNEVWSADKVHLVTSDATVPSGVSLAIEPGAVVKIMSGTSFTVASGGSCTARGVIFTHVNDDTIGGDTLYDSEATQPIMGDFTITGSIVDDDTTEYRYMPPQTLTSSITSNTRLRGYRTYIASNSVTVASGATLTLQPGTIIKFNSGCSLTVNGTLDAQGTRVAPIVFTSLKDDAHGGDTNGDGDKTSPDADDWRSIKVSGTANISFASILYGGGTSSSSDSGVLVGNSGGKITLANTTIAHAMYDGIFSRAAVTGENLIIHDCDRGINTCGGSGVFKNCVVDRCRWGVMAEGGSGTYYNCIITRFYGSSSWPTGWGVAYWSGSLKTYNCCVYSSLPGASNYRSSPTAVNNVIADPLFVDADNMDFRVAENSPCVDAGDGTVAPKADYYGQPRMDVKSVRNPGRPDDYGICPDIGIYEVPGVAAVPLPDLEVVGGVDINVAEGTVAPGDTVTVTYVVTNRGKTVASGLVRDLFRFKGVDASLGGLIAEAAEIGQSYNVATGACVTMTATITVPTLKTGNWKIGVEVNPSRDVFEQNLANNSAWSEDSINVEMNSIGVGSQSVTVNRGEVSGFILPALPLSGGVVRVTGANGMIMAYGGNGTVPTGSGGALGATSPVSIALADGSLLVTFPARAEGENAYLVLENGGSSAATVSVEVKEAELAIYDLMPGRIANMGEATITITGSGLAGLANVSFGGRTAKGVEVLNAAQIAATFDVEGMSAGTYDIVVSDSEGAIATQAKAVEVYAVKMGPKLRAWLEMPSSVRDGRVFTGYVCYANDGDSPMTMPVFKVARQDSSTKLGLVASENMTETSLYVGGVSPTHPAGVLKAGDEARIPFYFQPFGTYKITLAHIKDAEDMTAYPTFGGTKAYLAAMSAAATRLNLRGRTAYNIHDFVDQALCERNGIACAASSGYLVDAKTGEPLANADISLIGTGDSTNLPPATATTDENGYFQLTNLADGEYRWLLDSGNTLADSSTNTVMISAQSDLNNLTVFATQGGRISGFVMTDDGQSLEYAIVSRLDEDGALLDETQADGYGAFTFTGLIDGTYMLRAMPIGGYSAQTLEGIIIDGATRSQEAFFSLVRGGRISGFVTYCGEVVTNGIVQAITEAGESVQTLCATNGFYDIAGLAPGSYAVRYYSNTLESDDAWVDVASGDDRVLGIETTPRPLFEPTSSLGFDSLTTSFVFSDPVRADGVMVWAWDFDSDGIIDSTEREPTWTYNSIGTNTVTLTISEEGGITTSIYRNCVAVEKKLATILAVGAIVFGENEGSLVTLAMEKSSLTLAGNPAAGVIEVGNVILGKMGDEWYCRRVVSVQNLDGTWYLATENATWDEAYEQCTIVTTAEGVVVDETEKRGIRTLAAKAGGENKKKFELYREVGIDASVTVKPVVKFEHVYNKTSGKTVERFAFVGSLGIEGEVDISGTVGVKANKEIPVGFNIVIPTPVAGVTLENKWKAYIKGDAHVKGSASIGGEVKAALHLGAEWEKGKKAKWLKPFDASADGHLQGDVEGSVSLKVGIKPEFKAKLCGTASAVLAVDAFVKADVAASAKAPATAGVTAGLDLIGELNLIDWDWKIFDFKLGVSGKVKGPRLDILRWTSPDPDFEYSPRDNLEAPVTVNFTDKSKGATWKIFDTSFIRPITAWEWNLGNEQSSNLQNPSVTYSEKGTYTVSLKAKGDGINGPYRKKKKVKVGVKDDDDGKEENDDSKKDDSKKSWDPNEMVGDAGIGEARLVRPGQVLTYTIYFENKEGFDIADAQDVKVTNQLNEWLDWSSFEMREVAFNNQNDNSLGGLAKGCRDIKINGSDKYVRALVGGGTDGEGSIAETGVVHWRLRVYDPNGLLGWPNDGSGFLPSNDNTHRGEGHITYRIKVRDDAPANVIITNSASIVFDYNDPIETDPAWWNTVGMPGVGFAAADVSADEGGSASVRVKGGNAYSDSSVKLYLTYNTAAAADVDLANGGVDGVAPKGGLKFPLTLTWEAGEIGEKVVTIPAKTDKTLEDDEFFTLQLGDPIGMELGESRVCAVTIHDPGYDDLAAKVAAGTATKAEKSAWDKLQKAKVPYVLGLAEPADAGKVAGSGLCADGKKVTLKATANRGFVFVGWCNATGTQIATTATLVVDRTAKPAASSATSTTLTGVDEDATYYAKFITVDEDRAFITLNLLGEDLKSPSVAPTALETNVTCGVALEWPLAAAALSTTAVKVSGLPAGLKFDAKSNTIYGAPTAASAVDKKTGLTKPSEVKITVTTAGKSSVTYIVRLTVDPLPGWVVGTFSGDGYYKTAECWHGYAPYDFIFNLTVANNGKLTGSITVDVTAGKQEKSATFSAASAVGYDENAHVVLWWDWDGDWYEDVTFDGPAYYYDVDIKLDGKTKRRRLYICDMKDGAMYDGKERVYGVATAGFDHFEEVSGQAVVFCGDAKKNIWTDKSYDGPLPKFAAATVTKQETTEDGDVCTFSFKKNGSVAVTIVRADGQRDSASFTLSVMPQEDGAWFRAFGAWIFPKGSIACVDLIITPNADGLVGPDEIKIDNIDVDIDL